jgi:Asp-tRNA(Asn)/Glu-tRNA(Gln) amidotransferase A subunit family amidase
VSFTDLSASELAAGIRDGEFSSEEVVEAHIQHIEAVYGRCQNPYDLGRTPGGSSGGEAAIIAAHGSSLGLAGDFGGSTRVPAHFCGLCGLKPTSGRLTNEDTPSHFFAPQEAILPQPGPISPLRGRFAPGDGCLGEPVPPHVDGQCPSCTLVCP